MNRRRFLLGTIVGGTTIGCGVTWVSIEKNVEALTVDSALEILADIKLKSVTTTGQWDLYQILVHCAQSVEYSMTGYPQHKSDTFKMTVGNWAFSLFQSKGKMTHPLDEAIPGAPKFSQMQDLAAAFVRFEQSLIDFKNYTGNLAPHFAYGSLSKSQYEAAHVMHFNNHLSEIVTKT